MQAEVKSVFHNAKIWLTSDGRLEVYHARLATRLNKHFLKYESGYYVFQKGEEAVFQVPLDQTPTILKTFLTKKRA
jgi:hypothetical protein